MTIAFAKTMTPDAAALLVECRDRLGRGEAYILAARMGFSKIDTAAALGVSRQAVRQWAAYNDVTFYPAFAVVANSVRAELLKAVPDSTITLAEAAAAMGSSYDAAVIAARRAGVKMKRQPMPRPRAEEIAKLAAKGLTVSEVARTLGIPQAGVSRAKKLCGITFTRDGRTA